MATPNGLASVNGEIMPVVEATIPVTDEGLVRGDGVFEVFRVYNGVPFAMEEHFQRLERSARNMRLPLDLELTRTETAKFMAALSASPAGLGDEAVRIMCTRGDHRIIYNEPLYEYPEPLRMKTIEYAPTRVLDGIKSLSYGANRLASRLAQEQGYHEALLVTPDGLVLEAPTSTIFYVTGGELFTPPLTDHILASITRKTVLDAVDVTERSLTLDELLAADEAFLASTMREVAPIGQIDDREYPTAGPVSANVAKVVGAHIAELLAQGA